MTTLTGAAGLTVSLGSAGGGVVHSVLGGVVAFTGLNVVAAVVAWGGVLPRRHP
jgi:hypothetical protein